MIRPEPGTPLTSTEQKALGLAAQGFTDASIGRQLGVSPETARTHMRSVRCKLAARNRAHAVFLGVELGYIEVRREAVMAE